MKLESHQNGVYERGSSVFIVNSSHISSLLVKSIGNQTDSYFY